MIEKEDLVCRKIDKYETITSMFPLKVSSWEYPRRGYNGSVEWFICGKADSEAAAREGLWVATYLISRFA